MATLLQRQLADIAAKTTHQLDLKAKKAAHGKSLLFDAKVAVSQDFSILYQICFEGFEELRALDSRFIAYSTSIFSEQSKTEEREQMTAGQNAELGTVLESFLGLIGPRLLLKPAQKAVEWLVRRFRVHEYNTECLILTFLPYHSTPLFLSLLTILPRQLPHAFRFLYPSITAVDNPPLHTILYTATNNQAFFTAFNQYILRVCRARQHSSTIISFWASVTTQAIDGMTSAAQSGRETIQRQRQEDLMLRILPILNEGLSMRDVPELIIGCCMITTVLAAKSNLEDHVLDSMMEALATGWTIPTTEVRITSLAVIAQERSAAELPRAIVKKLLKLDEFTDRLLALSDRYRVDRLALGYVLGCFKRLLKKQGGSVQLEPVEKILRADLFGEVETQIIIKNLLSTAQKLQTSGGLAAEQQSSLMNLVTLLVESPSSAELFQRVLESSSFSQDELELSLQTVMPRRIEAPTVEGDSVVEDIQETAPDVEIDTALARISAQPLITASFMSAKMSEEFKLFYAVYLRSLSSEANLRKFATVPTLSQENSTAFISFYTRVWVGNYPQVARCAALGTVTAALKDAEKKDVDYQAIIPYLIVGLMDKSTAVRREAAECILALSHYYKIASSENKKPLSVAAIGNEAHFNTSLNNDKTASETAVDIIQKILVPDLDECVLDASMVSTLLATVLDSLSHSGHRNALKAIDLGLRTPRKISILTFLASHAATTPLLSVRLRLLTILNRVGKNSSGARSQILVPALRNWLAQTTANFAKLPDFQTSMLSDLDLEFFRVLTAREKDGIQLLKKIMTGEQPMARPELFHAAHRRLREVWPSIKSADGEPIALALYEAALSKPDTPFASTHQELCIESFRALPLSTETLITLVEILPSVVQMAEGPPSTKRRRTSRNEMVRATPIDAVELGQILRRYTIALEVVESSKPENHPKLLKYLFHALGKINDYRVQTNSGMVYLQGLAINALLAIVDKLKDTNNDAVDKRTIRTDVLVDCVRHTSNPQVQNAALLLISCLATWVPEVVLHSVMPIFTFMGTTILRQGDEYSAHVVDQTVSRVVPPLVTSLRRSGNVALGASEILLSFTAAFEHIPLHRRLGLFQNLAKTLGAQDCLYAIVAMIVDRYPTDIRARRFIVELVDSFEPSTNLIAIRQYIELIANIFKERRTLSETFLNMKDKSSEQTVEVARNLLDALADLLEDRTLRDHFVVSFHHDKEQGESQRTAFAALLQSAIRLSQFLNVRDRLSHPSARVLSNVMKLLPTVDLIKCAESILEQGDSEVSHVVLRSIDAQVRDTKHANPDSTNALLEFIPRVTSMVQSTENIMLHHSAIGCIDQIVEEFGKKDKLYVVSAAQIIAGENGLGHAEEHIKVVSMLCLATMVDVLQDDFIPFLPQVLPKVFEYLRSSISDQITDSNSAIATASAAFAAINAVAEHLAYMLSGEYLGTALQLVQQAAAVDMCADNRRRFYRLIGQNIAPAESFSAFNKNYSTLLQNVGHEVIREYVEALKFIIDKNPKATVKKLSSELFDILLKMFDHRRVADDEVDVEDVEAVYNDIAITIVLKLDDSTFRPFFIRLVEWAGSLPKKDFGGRIARATTLYKFLIVLFGRLKSLVTSYSSYVLDFTTDILNNTTSNTRAGIQLLISTLTFLNQSFTHDQSEFWQSPAHFTPISSSLVALLERSSISTRTPPSDLQPTLCTTITTLTSSTPSSDQHHELNAPLLKLLRSDDAGVRLAAVKVERSVTEKLGEEWLVLLPEMLPAVAEILEDSDEDVEREGRRWVKSVEEVLGESLEL